MTTATVASKRSESSLIQACALDCLQQGGYSGLRRVSCDFSDGVLTLTGKVEGYYLKQLAQALVAKIPGVARIVNRIVVHRHARNRDPEAAS